jgi:hypothetical protein
MARRRLRKSGVAQGAQARLPADVPERLQPLGVLTASVSFRAFGRAADTSLAEIQEYDADRDEAIALEYLLREGGDDELKLRLEGELPAGVRVGKIQVESGSIEVVVVLVAAYRLIGDFNEVVATLRAAAENLRSILVRLLAGRVASRAVVAADFVAEVAAPVSTGWADLIASISMRRTLAILATLVGTLTVLGLVAVLITYLFSLI